ncbi:MAG: serine/threonine protein kinase, partial [Gemmataceae bacterium]|nr:serine/threonine protein kinase [Gemmataceae bacterium]
TATRTVHQIKILDMGLARLKQSTDETLDNALTKTGVVIGTPDYLAPEQARNSRAVDIRADLYALGCTFFFLLTGKPPFPGEQLTEVLLKHQSDPPPELSAFRNDVPPGVQAILRKLMAKKPEERFQTPADLAAALAPFVRKKAAAAPAQDEAIQAAETVPLQAKKKASFAQSLSMLGVQRPFANKIGKRLSPVVIAALVGVPALLLLVILVVVLFSGSGSVAEKSGKAPVETSRPPETRRAEDELLSAVASAVRDNRTRQSAIVGGAFDRPQPEDVPAEGALLVGFEFSMREVLGHEFIGSIRPIFLTAQGEKLGTSIGKPSGRTMRYAAKKGYAVGTLVIRSTFVVESVQITFMKIEAKGLNKADTYKTDWIGGRGKDENILGGDGLPIIGIVGKKNNDNVSTGLGLVLMRQ